MSNSLRVFIVDDDRDFAESLAILLEDEGHEVVVAFSSEAAIEKFREQDFDIAFMDVTLPGMNGVESLLEIRKFKPAARVVMMSGYTAEQLLEQAITSGALGVLRKPLDLEEVLRLLDDVKLGRRRLPAY
jgi:DNA-binding NtrC family response regulator